MSILVLLDTSVYLNILDVPSFNQDREAILNEFEIRIQDHDLFFLPMATIWETGNHIAKLAHGGIRYQYGKKLLDDVTKAINGEVPYRATNFPSREEFLAWLAEFPEHVQRNKSDKKIGEGVSLSDLTIFKEWEDTRDRHPMSQVLIWSLDSDLKGYDTGVR
jgi:hypothetical protein